MSFEIGQLVLGKVPSYSKWPGVIVPEDKIPADVLKVKNSKTYCVFFFGDDPSFFWGDSKSVFPLELSACEAAAKKSKGAIKKAYKHALENKDNFLKVLDIPDGQDQQAPEEEEEAVLDQDEEEPIPSENADDYEEDEEDEEEQIKKTKRKAPVAKKAETKKTTTSAKRKFQESTPTSEEELAAKASTTSNKRKSDKKKQSSPPSHLTWNDEEKFKHFWFIRTKLQKGLISRADPPTEDELALLSNVLFKLETLDTDKVVDIKVLRSTKLHKVLKAILKLEKLERPNDFKFHERSAKLLEAWSPWIITIKGDKSTREGTPVSKRESSSKPGDVSEFKTEDSSIGVIDNGDSTVDSSIVPKKEETVV